LNPITHNRAKGNLRAIPHVKATTGEFDCVPDEHLPTALKLGRVDGLSREIFEVEVASSIASLVQLVGRFEDGRQRPLVR